MIIKRSLTVEKDLWAEAIRRAGRRQLSLVITRLLTMWLNGDIKITLDPKD